MGYGPVSTWTDGKLEVMYTLDHEESVIEIEEVQMGHEYLGKGHARASFKAFLNYLGKYDVHAIRLTACSSFDSDGEPGLPQHNLIEFYKDFGFTIYDYVDIDGMECPRMVELTCLMGD